MYRAYEESGRDAATALMYEAAEREYERIGERHDYGGLGAGVEAVLREMGGLADASSRELTSRFHSDLVGLASKLGKGNLTFAEVAHSLDQGYFPRREDATLPYPFGDGFTRSHVLQGVDLGRHLYLDWIVTEITDYLKSKRIRRGTKRYHEFISENAQKIVDAATKTATEAMQKASREAARDLAEAEKLMNEAHRAMADVRRVAEVRAAALRAADMEPEPQLAEVRAARAEAWEKVALQIGKAVQRLADEQVAFAEGHGAREAAIDAMAWRDELRPFLDAAGIAYEGLPEWKRGASGASGASEGRLADHLGPEGEYFVDFVENGEVETAGPMDSYDEAKAVAEDIRGDGLRVQAVYEATPDGRVKVLAS